VSPIVVSMVVVALVSLMFLWLSGRLQIANGSAEAAEDRDAYGVKRDISRSWWIPLALIPAVVLLFQFPASLPIWNLGPKLRFLQFPWRWMLVVEAPMAIFFAAAAWAVGARVRWLRRLVPVVCALLFIAATVVAMRSFFRNDPRANSLPTILNKYRSGVGFVGTDEYASPGSDNYIVATGLPDACLASDFDTELGVAPNSEDNPAWRPDQRSCTSTATAQMRQPEHMQIKTVASHSGFLILRLRSYPAWRVTVNGQLATDLRTRDDGLIVVPVSQGPVEMSVDWVTTRDVIAGRSVSVLALMALIAVGLTESRLRRTRQS
jgi:hypothetical protein